MTAEENTFKTGQDIPIDFDLEIEGEVVSSLPQFVIVLYYLRNEKRIKFSYHALDIGEAEIAQEAIDEEKTLNTIVLNGEILEIIVPIAETDVLKLEVCEEVQVLAEITYVDSGGKKNKVLDADNCDVCVGTMTKSITEGWL